tara:strand:- start:48 stop:1097 length:1050 start_codon:yes stop_codon:yes gene_type:complete
MAYTTINKSTAHFNTKTYSGTTNSSDAISGIGFQPDLVWLKSRSNAGWHWLTDAVRGVTKTVYSNATTAEETNADGVTAFGADGFTIANNSDINGSGKTFCSWNWKAGGGQGSANTDGSINTTYTSVNTTAGFSICKWTGTGSAGTIGHGLGATPGMIMFKNLSSTNSWVVWNKTFNARTRLVLNGTNAVSTSQTGFMNDTLPTSSVIHLKDDSDTNGSGNQMIAYVFAEKTGYSKFGSYKGNGSNNGSFCYLGFKPAFVLVKNTQQGGDNWFMWDNKRSEYNQTQKYLSPNSNNTEADSSSYAIDILSNGFKVRSSTGAINNNNETMIYMAFAESPLVGSNNVPNTAR